MTYADPSTKSSGDTYTLADWNVFRDNWLASAVRAMDAKGDIVAGTGANALARVAVGADDAILVAASGETAGVAWQYIPACRVYRNSNLSLTAATWTAVAFGQERFDLDDLHSTASNTERISITESGIYQIGATIEFDTSSLTGHGAFYGVGFRLNGSTYIAREFREQAVDSEKISITLSTIYSMAGTDYVEAMVYASRNDTPVAATGNYSPEFWAIWLRRQ